MIYLTLKGGQRILIIGKENVAGLKNGAPIITPDRALMVMYTRDEDYLQKKISGALIVGELERDTLKAIFDDCDARELQIAENEGKGVPPSTNPWKQ